MIHRLCAVLAVAALLVACQPADARNPATVDTRSTAVPTPSERTAEGATLRWAISPPLGVDPTTGVDESGLLVVDAVFDSLTAVTETGAVRPSAAIGWEAFDAGRRWRFALRPDAVFHDGSPVTAGDFARGWAATVREGRTGPHLQHVDGYRAVRAGRANQLAGVRAVDATTLEVTLTVPDMAFPSAVAHPSLAPLPAVALDDAAEFAVAPVGNGPFRMVERWVRGQFIRVERADDWDNGPAEQSAERVREILFRIIDANAAYVGFQQGRIDVAPIPAGALDQARRTYGDRGVDDDAGVVDDPVPSLYFLGIRVDQPPWDDPEVRWALSRAIDRQTLVETQRDRQLDVARAIVPPPIPGSGGAFCDACLHLPTLAEGAFSRAGVTEITLTYDEHGGHEPIVRRVQADLAEVGVRLRARAVPFEEYLTALQAGQPTLFRFGWQAQAPTAGAMLDAVVGSGAPAEPGDGANYMGYASEAVDALLVEARQAASSQQRQQLWARAEQAVLDDMPIVPLFTSRQRSVISDRVENLTLTPWGTATPERARIVAEPEILQ